ncbi:MAG: bifunctional rhamnulose-1-phosphate aldolase/short-chain dehydrogenase, partial [Kordiimonadaceae bacterium]|nr:bifunctional rhamnulose-1-phosphate aldolase/short-chain dehydrogenase [Kordiimonadaceae bacterium]
MSNQLNSLWDDATSAKMSDPELLKYRSNLLGSDLRITNYGGGNTSSKTIERDHLSGKDVDVLWVKGAGGDLGSIKMDGFSTLYMEKLLQLRTLYRGLEHEDEMVAYLPHCTFNLNPRAASIDTPLHTYIPHKHVDHMHPDSVIALACTKNSEELTEKVFGGKIGWLPWQRPGYDLGLNLEKIALDNPEYDGVILAGHGLFTWANTSKSCYEKTLEVINQAQAWLDETNTSVAFGGVRYAEPLAEDIQNDVVSELMPVIRGKITGDQMKVGHFNCSDEIIEFVNSQNVIELAALGTSCPDHFLRTKIRPLVLDFNPEADDVSNETKRVVDTFDQQLEAYRNDYAGYYERSKHDDSPAMRDPNAVVYLVPGVGMITFAKDKATARIAGEFYVNAINVMRQANGVDTYVGLDEQEAFNIEYWLLEEAKLQRMPKPKKLAGHIAFVTGGAGGIGAATARRLLDDGACVMLADIDEEAIANIY